MCKTIDVVNSEFPELDLIGEYEALGIYLFDPMF